MTTSTDTHSVVRRSDVNDFLPGQDGSYLTYASDLGSAQIGFNVRELAPGERSIIPGKSQRWGHAHREIEEIYYVAEGEIRVKAGEEHVTLATGDAICVQPGTFRGMENRTSSPARVVMMSRSVENAMQEVDMDDDFWNDDPAA